MQGEMFITAASMTQGSEVESNRAGVLYSAIINMQKVLSFKTLNIRLF
jgi:hypothetical protein